MKKAWLRFDVVAVWGALALLTGCGGGGGAAGGANVLPVVSPTQTPVTQSGPVAYLQNTGPLSTSGSITQGTHQAIVAIMSSADQSSKDFASDSLVVSTPGGTSQSAARSMRHAIAAPGRVSPVEAFPADDGGLLQRLQRFSVRNAAPQTAARSRQSTLPAILRAGVQANIWVQQGPMSGSRPSILIPATLLAQTAHANIWVDDTIAHSLQGSIAQVGTDFENAYASDTKHFAWPDYPSNAPGLQPQYASCSGNGSRQGTTPAYIQEPADHRVDVMVVNGPSLGGLGGYFSVANFMPQVALNCLTAGYESNEAPFIFVGYFSGNGQTYELQEDLVRSTAHELQHLINFVNHGILASGASSASFNGYESTFVNEGLSMLAQDFAVQAMYGSQGVQFDAADALVRANAYLNDPGNYSLTGFTGIDSANWGGGAPVYNCSGGCYGGAYLFQRYLRDRFGGDAYTHAMETSGVVGPQNLQAATGESAGELQDDFALAMAANTMGITSPDHRFDFGSLSLTQSYHDQFGGSTALSGVFAAPVSGTSTTVHAALGGFAYVAIPSVPASGMNVQVTDQASVSGFGLAGGLAQH